MKLSPFTWRDIVIEVRAWFTEFRTADTRTKLALIAAVAALTTCFGMIIYRP